MARLSAFIVLGLFAITALSYSVKEAPTFHMDSALLEQMKPQNNKKSFSDIMVMIQSGGFQGSDSRIYEFLNEFRSQIAAEAQEHQELHATQVQQCADEKEFRKSEMNTAKNSRSAADGKRAECASESATAATLQQIAETYLTIYGNQLENLEAFRKQQIKTYETRSKKLSDAATAIADALDILSEFEVEAGLNAEGQATVTTLLQACNVMLLATASTSHIEKTLPIYSAMIQMGTQGDFNPEDVATVREKIEEIQANVDAAITELDEDEVNNKAAYDAKKAELQGLIAKLTNQKTRAASYKVEMDACVESETEIYNMADAKWTNNKELLAHAIQICEANEAEFAASKKSRARELKLLNQLEYAIKELEKSYAGSVLPKVDKIIEVKKTQEQQDDERAQAEAEAEADI
mmetsp:Transcript_18571/g.16175  ORF Transcript_18571/g.16175 Transcript_18571/m.16175 type:complete len:408 (-) Transcript_18571:308-1531(-)